MNAVEVVFGTLDTSEFRQALLFGSRGGAQDTYAPSYLRNRYSLSVFGAHKRVCYGIMICVSVIAIVVKLLLCCAASTSLCGWAKKQKRKRKRGETVETLGARYNVTVYIRRAFTPSSSRLA